MNIPSHPEGHEQVPLEPYDHRHWHLGVYEMCLENPDMLRAAFKRTEKDIARDYGNLKYHQRWRGLELLKEVNE